MTDGIEQLGGGANPEREGWRGAPSEFSIVQLALGVIRSNHGILRCDEAS